MSLATRVSSHGLMRVSFKAITMGLGVHVLRDHTHVTLAYEMDEDVK